MSSITPNNTDQEIDLRQVSQKMGQAYESFLSWIFRGFLFVKRNLIVLIVLFVLGAGIGFYLDKNTTVYNHEVMVLPNFGSVEYTYSKIDLINSKIKENDISFLKSIGIVNPKNLSEILIEPINDIYEFANKNDRNFEVIKLMSENGDINKIIEDKTTSRNYKYHRIKITTSKLAKRSDLLEPILKYLNDSEYYEEVHKSVVESLIKNNEVDENTVNQINNLLASFSEATTSGKNSPMVYINENTQLNDVLKTKTELIQSIAYRKIELINATKIVKESSTVLNVKNTKSLNGKMKYTIPLLFISIFLLLGILKSFYRNQMRKLSNANFA